MSTTDDAPHAQPPNEPRRTSDAPPESPEPASGAHETEGPGAQLIGALPCCVCGYELRGLSIRGNCPECGTAVRATILHRVDPHAAAFKPLVAPRLAARSCRVWTLAPLAAAIALWAARLTELAAPAGRPALAWHPLNQIALAAIALGAIASLPLIRPIADLPRRKTAAAALGTILGYPLLITGLALTVNADANQLPAYLSQRPPDPERLLARTVFNAGALVTILAHRPVARELVARSRVLRTKKVDRQTLAAIAAAVALALLGDALRYASLHAHDAARPLELLGTATVAFASALITLGLVGAAVDAARIATALRTPTPTHRQLLGEHTPTARHADTPHADTP